MVSVCHITSVHPIEDIRIFHKECVSLAKNGYNVTLIACGETEYNKVKNGVKLISLKIPVKNRIQRMLKRTRAVYQKALEVDADIYHLHDPELLHFGLKLKRKGKKIIFDSHEDVPSDILHKKYLFFILRFLLSILYQLYEIYSLRKYDAVISVTPHIVDRLLTINKKTFQITNYPIVNKNVELLNIEKLTKPTMFFAGGVSPLWMHENILKAIEEINITYIVAGNSTNSYLETLKSYKSWKKVVYLGNISHEEVNCWYRKCHVGVALMDYSVSAGGKKGTLGNTKLFEIMLAGIPVLCTDFTIWSEIVDANKTGYCINPHDIKSITDTLKKMFSNPKECEAMGKRGKKIALEKYTWETQERILIDLYKHIK